MAAQKEQVLEYKDLNAEKYPEPVERIAIDKYNICAATIDMKDPAVAGLVGLFTIHAVIRRSLRCVARQARTVEPSKRASFIVYAKYAFDLLDAHHHHEDELWFPVMKPYVDFTESTTEHEAIEHLISEDVAYVKQAQAHLNGGADAPAWPGEEISSTTEKLLDLLLPHLLKEETLSCLYGRRCPDQVFIETDKKLEEMVLKEMKKDGMLWSVAFQMRHWSKKEKEVWPPMPFIVRTLFEFFGWVGYGKYLQFGPTEEELKN
ncbi:hypothetical protein ABW19_dt0203165 [Dactylella cylindrospora]|nr:hypothetical protein ABW19_dt0203165 [Dactylella cylindrospora]